MGWGSVAGATAVLGQAPATVEDEAFLASMVDVASEVAYARRAAAGYLQVDGSPEDPTTSPSARVTSGTDDLAAWFYRQRGSVLHVPEYGEVGAQLDLYGSIPTPIKVKLGIGRPVAS